MILLTTKGHNAIKMDLSFDVSVILPAAGCGMRYGSSKPKQFCMVLGKPLICHTIQSFERIPWVKKIVVVTALDCIELMREIVEENGYHFCDVVAGGVSRHQSISAGVKALTHSDMIPDIVVVHDGVRPLVPIDVLKEVVIAAKKHGAAGAIRPLTSTVVSKNGENYMEQSLDRSAYYASEMPQAFQYNVLKTAYEKCSEHDLINGTECLQLVLKYAGVKAKLIDGTPDLWKVTYKKDIFAAEGMLKEQSNHILIVTDHVQSSLVETIQKSLDTKSSKVTVCNSKIREPGDYREYSNIIFLHFDKSLEDIVPSGGKLEENLSASCSDDVQGVTIHVLTYTKEPFPEMSRFQSAYAAAKKIANVKRRPFTCCHIIWNVELMNHNRDTKISNMITDLIESRSLAFHGQLFLV
ncbi:hypothetical protein CHUAL_006593 [Chamberlinius hualienensis]